MVRRFSRSLAAQLGIAVVLIECGFMAVVGILYFDNFSRQVDERQQERMEVASQIVLDGDLNLTSLADRDKMSRLVGDEIADAILINEEGTVVFSLDPNYRRVRVEDVLFLDPSQIDFSSTSITFEHFTFEGEPYITSSAVFHTGGRQFLLFFRTSTGKTQTEKAEIALLIAAGFSITVVATSAVIYLFFSRSLLVRLDDLVKVVRRVEGGDLTVRVSPRLTRHSRQADELSILQNGTNAMIARLQDLVQTLEQKVADRTRDLTISAQVSRQVARELNQQTLLSQLVELTKTSFDLYQVNVYLFNAKTRRLKLTAASGEAGAKLLQLEAEIPLDSERGLVPTAARTKLPVVINDVAQSEMHRPNPSFPETRSEIAVPILFSADVIGVLDLQSDKSDRFSTSDTDLFSSFADQIAVAIRNAGLFDALEEARRHAEQADKIKSAFLANMSHELRTPLNAILNFSKFMRRGVSGPVTPKQVDLLTSIVDSGQHLLHLINDVLDMSKIESDSLKLFIEPEIDLTQIIDTAIEFTAPILAEKPVTLSTEYPETLPLIAGDRKRLLQVIVNVISNACKFTDEGQIRVVVQAVNTHVFITIEDTGSGIAREDYEAVFEPFRQTDSGLRQGGGTGLGMPISKKLVEAHHGNIWFTSQLNQGTTFYIELPVESRSE